MFATVEWEAVTLAGAFILGSVMTAIALLRLTRAVLDNIHREQRRRDRERDDE